MIVKSKKVFQKYQMVFNIFSINTQFAKINGKITQYLFSQKDRIQDKMLERRA
jgi:hypothetical protein